MSRLLLVDDDPAIRSSLSLALQALGHEVETATDGLSALSLLRPGHRFDVVLLDVMMPGIDGFEVCRQLRPRDAVPVIMLTARTDPIDVVVSLETGADDHVAKPCEPRVIDARIKALLRRGIRPPVSSVWSVGGLEIDEAGATVRRGGQLIDLTATEFRLLVALASEAGWVQLGGADHQGGHSFRRSVRRGSTSTTVESNCPRCRARCSRPGLAPARCW